MPTPQQAANAIELFLNEAEGLYHRYQSWDYCFLAFQEARARQAIGEAIDFDFLSIHLSVYLSSWGMLRNSFLLQHNYKVHSDVIKVLFEPTFQALWEIPVINDPTQRNKFIDEQWKLIRKIHCRFSAIYNNNNRPITETLVTKILLGTCGATPAYDRLYKKGRKRFQGTQKFGKKSYSEILRYYWDNWEKIEEHLQGTSLTIQNNPALTYPPMKLMDMCFWQLGNDI